MRQLKLIVVIILVIAGQSTEILVSQEYINDIFSGWINSGITGSPNTWTSGTQDIQCLDGITRTFGFENCIINNLDVTS